MKHCLHWQTFAIAMQILLVLPVMVLADQNRSFTLDEVLQHLHTRQLTLTTLVAKFQQIQHNELFAEPQKSAGTLYFDRADKLLIKMHQPEPYFVLLTDGKMISGTPGSTPRSKDLPGDKTSFPERLGIDQSVHQLKKQFTLLMNHNPDGHIYGLELKPRKVNRRMPYASIQAEIDSHLWLPVNLKLIEPGGDWVYFAFDFITLNSPLPENIFNIVPVDADPMTSDDIHDSK